MDPLYVLEGMGVKGNKRGKKLGFPTANIRLTQNIPEGIYASEVLINNKLHKAATFIGAAKTFAEDLVQAESYLLYFSADLYGKKITVKLYNKIRGNKKFTSAEELIEQMKKDVDKVRKLMGK